MTRYTVVCLALFCGCSSSPQEAVVSPAGTAAEKQQPTVYTVNYPLQYFAERIAGDHVRVIFPMTEDLDPAYWQPDEDAVQGYQQADLILLNGAMYAKWTGRVSLPLSRLVNTSRSFQDRYIELEDQTVHQHGPEGEHAHGDYAFTTWLNPQLAMEQAKAIQESFTQRWPEWTDEFALGQQNLRSDLEALDAKLAEVNQRYEGQPLLASHPVYQYLAHCCQWNLKSLHWEPNANPDESQWQELEKRLADHPAQWMIWEAEPLGETRERLQELGIGCVVFNPCSTHPSNGDYLRVMRQNIENLRPIFLAPDH